MADRGSYFVTTYRGHRLHGDKETEEGKRKKERRKKELIKKSRKRKEKEIKENKREIK